MTLINLARLGPLQLKDIHECHNEYARVCTVLKNFPAKSPIGDITPMQMAYYFEGNADYWPLYNKQFVIQVAGCPLHCPYCYVDNLNADVQMTVREIVDMFKEFKEKEPDIRVFHLMGGAPGQYATYWPQLRRWLDHYDFNDVILLSDSILLENTVYRVPAWDYVPIGCMINVCIKGTTPKNFFENTGGSKLFFNAMEELKHWRSCSAALFTTLRPDIENLRFIEDYVGRPITELTYHEYEACKR